MPKRGQRLLTLFTVDCICYTTRDETGRLLQRNHTKRNGRRYILRIYGVFSAIRELAGGDMEYVYVIFLCLD